MSIWKSVTGDKIQNGAIGGAVAGALMYWGEKVVEFAESIVPQPAQTFAGELSIPIIFIGLFALIGLILDKY